MLIPNGSQPLETSRLLLRPFTEADGDAMYRNWASDPMVARYVTWNAHQSPDDSRALCRLWAEEMADPLKFRWAVVLKETGEPIGSMDVVELDSESCSGEIGYALGRPFWGRGFASEACQAMIYYLFSACGFEAITACHDIRNPASGRVMEKCGLRYSHDETLPLPLKQSTVTVRCYRLDRKDWRPASGTVILNP